MSRLRRAGKILVWCAAACLVATPAVPASLRYAGTTPPLTFDPHATNDFVTASLVRQVYDSLVGLDDRMELEPGLRHELDAAGREYVALQPSAGRHLPRRVAADRRRRRVLDHASEGEPALRGPLRRHQRAAKAVDDATVDVVSRRAGPDPAAQDGAPVRHVARLGEANGVEKVPDLGAQGTRGLHAAPRQRHRPDAARLAGARTPHGVRPQRRVLGAGAGNVEEAIYTPIGSAPTRVAALLSSEVDLVTDLPLQDIERVKATPGFKVEQAPQQLFMQLEMDGTRDVALDVFDKAGQPLKANPFKDLRVRQAFAHAIDANLIVERVMRGQAPVIGTASAAGSAATRRISRHALADGSRQG